jgi:phage terminase large subunit
MVVQWCKWSKIANEAFIPYVKNTDRYLIFYGGRGSSKSNFCAKRLIYLCLTEKYFRFILIRQNYNTIKDSQYQTIKDIIYELGLQSLFEFRLQPLEIECINGNKFLARGLDDTNKLKSIKDPSGAWWEEDIPIESDFITVTTSIRTKKARFLQEIFTINPEVEGDYQDHWFYKQFFEGKDKTHSGFIGQNKYSVHHSTYKDNRYLPQAFKDFLEGMRTSNNPTNRYYYTVYTLGEWGNKITGGNIYKMFDRARAVYEVEYNPSLPIWLSFDFNVNPGMHVAVMQIDGLELRVIDEIITTSPRNNTRGACADFIRKYENHQSGLFVTGDPAGKHEDTRSEQGFNDYTIIRDELRQFRPVIKMHQSAPAVVKRINFINNIFEFNQSGITIKINPKCTALIADLLNTKEAEDGTKHKAKVKDKDTGVSYEKYGHIGDSFEYGVIKIFERKYNEYLRAGSSTNTKQGGAREILESHSY